MAKHFDYGDDDIYASFKEINNNTYYIILVETDFVGYTKQVVHVEAVEGDIPREIPHPNTVSFDRIIDKNRIEEKSDNPTESFVANVVSDAVSIYENREDEKDDMKQRVEAALEANAEIHGGIEYQLDQ